MNQKPKFKQTEIGMIPQEWEVKKIGDCIELAYGKGLPERDRKKGNIPVFGSNGIVGYHNEALVKGPGIIIGRKGSVGEITFSKQDFWPIDTTYFVKTKENNDIVFWYYFLKTLNLNLMNIHSAVPGLNRENVYEIKKHLPPLPEQRAIAKILSDLNAKIELNQQMNKTLEEIGRAIFKHWFVDFEFPNEEGKPYKSSGGEMEYNEELRKEIPKGWGVKRLNEISDNFDFKRIPLSSRERESKKGDYPYYGATGILDYVNDYIFDGTFILMGEDGSVIDEKGYPIIQYVWGRFWVNNHAHVLKGKNISDEILYLLLKNTNVSHIITGAVQPKINQNNMNRLMFPIPDSLMLAKLYTVFVPLFQKLKSNYEEIKYLSSIRDLLLPKLMTGKIRVPACTTCAGTDEDQSTEQ